MLTAIMQCSKLQFLFVCKQKQLARVLPESSAVICAESVAQHKHHGYTREAD